MKLKTLSIQFWTCPAKFVNDNFCCIKYWLMFSKMMTHCWNWLPSRTLTYIRDVIVIIKIWWKTYLDNTFVGMSLFYFHVFYWVTLQMELNYELKYIYFCGQKQFSILLTANIYPFFARSFVELRYLMIVSCVHRKVVVDNTYAYKTDAKHFCK